MVITNNFLHFLSIILIELGLIRGFVAQCVDDLEKKEVFIDRQAKRRVGKLFDTIAQSEESVVWQIAFGRCSKDCNKSG